MRNLHRFVFSFLILALALLLFFPILLYLFGASALKTFDATYEIDRATTATYGVKNCSIRTDTFRVSIDRMVLPKPLFLVSEWLLHRKIANGIHIQRLEIQSTETGPDFDSGASPEGKNFKMVADSILRSLRHCPFLSLPFIEIDGIFFENVPIYLANFRIADGRLSFDLLQKEPESMGQNGAVASVESPSSPTGDAYGSLTAAKKCSVCCHIRSLRRSLETYFSMAEKLRRRRNGLAWMDLLNGRIAINDLPLNLLERILPEYLKSEGTIDADLAFGSGQVHGNLRVEGMQTWPVPWIGALQNIAIAVRFDGRRILFQRCRGQSSDREFSLVGSIDWSSDTHPIYDLHFSGADLPFVKTGNINLRGNLDLFLRTENGRTTLGGDIEMARGILTSDTINFGAELRRTIGRAASFRRPDFWTQCGLNINLHGDKFMRVNSTYLRGLLSAQLAISGTIDRPAIGGKIVINSGHILFPFARFRIDAGTLDFDPLREPKVSISAGTRLYGYDLTLLIDGDLKKPILTFNSVPSLANAEIVTMLTSGRIPEHMLNGNSSGNQWGALNFYLNSGFFGENLPEHIHMQIGEDITENGLETMEIEYVFDRRRSLIGQYDRFDNYNVDYKFRIYAK